MDRDILEQIWPIFVAESREQLQEIGSALLHLEHGPGPDGLLGSVKRHAHSLKGSAAAIGLGDVERVAHALEELIGRCGTGTGIGAAGVAAALRAIAAVEGAFDEGMPDGRLRIQDLAALLQELAERGATVEAAGALASPPNAEPAGRSGVSHFAPRNVPAPDD